MSKLFPCVCFQQSFVWMTLAKQSSVDIWLVNVSTWYFIRKTHKLIRKTHKLRSNTVHKRVKILLLNQSMAWHFYIKSDIDDYIVQSSIRLKYWLLSADQVCPVNELISFLHLYETTEHRRTAKYRNVDIHKVILFGPSLLSISVLMCAKKLVTRQNKISLIDRASSH